MSKVLILSLLGGGLVLALLWFLAHSASGPKTGIAVTFMPAGPENFLPIAGFRVTPNPDAARIESVTRAFAAAEGLTVEDDRKGLHAPVSLMISVNDYTKLYIVKTGPEMPGFFSMTLQQKHSGEAPAQLALFERLKETARAEFPDLTIEISE